MYGFFSKDTNIPDCFMFFRSVLHFLYVKTVKPCRTINIVFNVFKGSSGGEENTVDGDTLTYTTGGLFTAVGTGT